MIKDYLKNEMLIITPHQSKMDILISLSQEEQLLDLKFMTKEEFFRQYFFSYDESAYYYLQQKYHYDLDVCKLYLKNMYVIEEKDYKSEKLNKLKELKRELLEKGLLSSNKLFLKYIKTRKILVYNYSRFEKYEQQILDSLEAIFYKDDKEYPLPSKIIEAKSMEDEIVYLSSSIRQLNKKGVSFSHIHLVNVSDDYSFLLKRIFSYFQIPIQSITPNTLYGTTLVANYLKTKEVNLEDSSKANAKLIQVINSLSKLEEGVIKQNILIDKLKHTSITDQLVEDAVNINNLNANYTEDDYVFLIGMNTDQFPKLCQDDDFILDFEKEEVPLYKTDEKNKIIKETTKTALKRIPNLFLSYKLESSFQNFYKSSFIEELAIPTEKLKKDFYKYSNLYNKLYLAECLDDYYKFGTIREKMASLYETYKEIPYHSYDSTYTGINKATLKNYLKNELHLSYTHLQNYYLCGFKYYVNHILKVDPYEKNFSTTIGNMFHEALKYMDCEDFDLDLFMTKFLELGEYSPKEKFFLKQLKKDLKKTIHTVREQREYTEFRESYLEKTVQVDFSIENFKIMLKGTIDKIMYYKNVSDTYYAVIDYKSGSYDTNLKKIQFGLNMQLPIYLYLIENSRIFSSPIFAGFYYQKLMQPKKTYDKKEDTLKLEGYSYSDPTILEKFDNSYQKSDIIKGLALKQDGTFSAHSKLLNEDAVAEILKTVEEKVMKARDDIIEGMFPINPKSLEKENISCKYCTYRDLCFMKEKDLVYLKVEKEEKKETEAISI